MEQITIHCTTLEEYIAALSKLDPETQTINVTYTPDGLEGMIVNIDGIDYTVVDVDREGKEEPMLGLIRKGLEEYDNTLDDEVDLDPKTKEQGYTTSESTSGIQAEFKSGGESPLTAGYRLARNIPGFENGSIVGYYWVALSTVMENLRKDVVSVKRKQYFVMIDVEDESGTDRNLTEDHDFMAEALFERMDTMDDVTIHKIVVKDSVEELFKEFAFVGKYTLVVLYGDVVNHVEQIEDYHAALIKAKELEAQPHFDNLNNGDLVQIWFDKDCLYASDRPLETE